MPPNERNAIDPAELAELYALGLLDDAQRTHFETRIADADPDFLEAWAKLRPLAEGVHDTKDSEAPRPSVLDKLRDRIASADAAPFTTLDDELDEDPDVSDAARLVLLRAAEMQWTETGVPGVQAKNLFADRQSSRLTLLIRMSPGAVFPDHEHHGVEECMVLTGDLTIAGTTLHAGDYLRTPRGARHGTPSTEQGCVLLVTTPFQSAA